MRSSENPLDRLSTPITRALAGQIRRNPSPPQKSPRGRSQGEAVWAKAGPQRVRWVRLDEGVLLASSCFGSSLQQMFLLHAWDPVVVSGTWLVRHVSGKTIEKSTLPDPGSHKLCVKPYLRCR